MNQSNEDLKISHKVFIEMLHNLPTSHSNSSSITTFCGCGISPNMTSSQKSSHGFNEHLALISLKLFHVSCTTMHLMKPCSNVSNTALLQRLQMSPCLILVHHAPIGSPSANINHNMVEILFRSHRCHTF